MPFGDTTSEAIERVAREIVDAAFKIHAALGPGLLESSYQEPMIYELKKRGLRVADEVPVPIRYDGQIFETEYRLDLLVEDLVIVELKSVSEIIPIYKVQVLTYLKLMEKRLGLLISFNVEYIKDGIKRVVL
jgi:GxxExxY protein